MSADHELAEWAGYAYFRQPHMAVLQSARAWMLAVEGGPNTKLSAGQWALSRWPNSELLNQAIARQRGNLLAVVDEGDARDLLAHAWNAVRLRTRAAITAASLG
jgi:hypothetical protein